MSVCERLGAACGEALGLLLFGMVVCVFEFDRAIRTARLHPLPDFDLRPIDVVVFHGP